MLSGTDIVLPGKQHLYHKIRKELVYEYRKIITNV